jgi:flavin-dependent dehydrogenase
MLDQSAFDVIVIGSGPAGCAAASTCAQAGMNVLMVTDQPEQSPQTTSVVAPLESIHPGVSSLLKKIDAAGVELIATRGTYFGIQASNNYTPLGEDSDGPWQGMHIHREIFNSHLLDRIQASGIPVRVNEKVESFIQENNKVVGIKTKKTDLNATYIIDASGKKAIAGKKLNFKRKFYSPPLACWTGISKCGNSIPFDNTKAYFIPGNNGWSWIATYADYCAWTRLSLPGDKSLLPPDKLKDGEVIGKVQFANMRWRLYRPVCTEGLILCGDAAGILDPAAGQGIFNALLSGIVAANTVVSCIQKPDTAAFQLAYYDDWFVKQFEEKAERLRLYYKELKIEIFN